MAVIDVLLKRKVENATKTKRANITHTNGCVCVCVRTKEAERMRVEKNTVSVLNFPRGFILVLLPQLGTRCSQSNGAE